MKRTRTALGLLLLTALGAGALAQAATPAVPLDAYPAAAPGYAVVANGRLIWGRALDAPRPPASLTKLLTALLLLERNWDPDAIVTASARAVAVDGTRLGLRRGESLRAADALTALLVRSANDVCIALAEHAAGSVETFVVRMNERAAALGLAHSSFENPCGLDAPRQLSTPRDLLRLGSLAIAQREIAQRARLAQAAVVTTGGRRIAFHSGNALLGRVDGVIGLKSGFTTRAGKCVIAVAVRGSNQVWLVMLGAEERWWTASGIIEAAFRELPPAPAGATASPTVARP